MWAAPDETSAFIIDLYQRVWAHADATIAALDLDATGRVPWWPEGRATVTLHQILVHMVDELNRHAGHADIVRELIDGTAGLRQGADNLPQSDPAWWTAYHDKVEQAARQAARTIAFTATEFGDDTDEDARVVGLADSSDGAGRYLMLQVPTGPPTDQDTALGMDTYYLEIDGQGSSRYGGIAHCRRHGNVLTLELTEEAAADLGFERIIIALDLPESDLRALHAALRTALTYGDPSQHAILDLQ